MRISKVTYAQFEPNFEPSIENALACVELEKLAKAFFADIRALPYFTRHGMMDRFSRPELFDSSTSAKKFWESGTRNLSEEQVANIVFNVFCRFLRRLNWSYQSGGRKPRMFSKDDPDGDALIWNPSTRKLEGQSTLYGQKVYLAECSTLARSLCDAFVAFGIPGSRVGVCFVEPDQPGNMLAVRVANEVQRSANIFGADLDSPMSTMSVFDVRSVKGRERYHEPGEVFLERLIDRWVNEVGPTGLRTAGGRAAVAARIRPRASNTLMLAENSKMHPLTRDVFLNHFCAFIVPKRGERWTATFFDPLYELRYVNGLQDFYEEYALTATVHCVPDSVLPANQAKVLVGERREHALVEIPQAFMPIIDFTWFQYKYIEGADADPDVPFDVLRLEYQRDDGAPVQANLDFLEFLVARHGTLYFAVDDTEYSEDAQGHPWDVGQIKAMLRDWARQQAAQAERGRLARAPRPRALSLSQGEARRASVGAEQPVSQGRPRSSSLKPGWRPGR